MSFAAPAASAAPSGQDSAAAAQQRAAALAANPAAAGDLLRSFTSLNALRFANRTFSFGKSASKVEAHDCCSFPALAGVFDPTLPHFEAELEINDFPQHARWKVRSLFCCAVKS